MASNEAKPQNLSNGFLKTEYLVLTRDCAGEQEYVRDICAADYNLKTSDTESEKMRKILDDASIECVYRKSAEKL